MEPGAAQIVTVTFQPNFAPPTGEAIGGGVDITADGEPSGGVQFDGFALQAPEIFDSVIFGKTNQGTTIVEISGKSLPTPAVGSTITVGTHTVTVTSTAPETDHPEDDRIVGTVSADISTFTGNTQTLNVIIEGDTFTGVEFDIFKAGDVPQVIAGDIQEVSTGITEVELFGANIPSTTADYTSVMVGGFPVTGVAVTTDTEYETIAGIVIIEILGTISQDITTFATDTQEEVSLDVVLTSAALPGGSLTETGVRIFVDHFDGDPGPGPDPGPAGFNINSGDFFDAGAGNVTVKLFGIEFPSDITASTITITGPGFTGQVTGILSPQPDPNDTSGGGEFIEGTIVADFSSLIEGDYAVDVTNVTGGPFNFPTVFFFPGGPGGDPGGDLFLGGILFNESTNTGEVNVTVFGDGFDQLSTSIVVSFSTESGLLGTVYTLFGHFATPGDAVNPDKIEGSIFANIADLNLDQYWVRLQDGADIIENFVPVETGGGTPGESGIFFGSFGPSDDPNSSFVELRGIGLPAGINDVSITGTDGIKHTFATLLVSTDPAIPEDTIIEGNIPVPFDVIIEGLYTVEIASPAGIEIFDNVTIGKEGARPAGRFIFGGGIHPSDDNLQTEIELNGLELVGVVNTGHVIELSQVEDPFAVEFAFAVTDVSTGPEGIDRLTDFLEHLLRRSQWVTISAELSSLPIHFHLIFFTKHRHSRLYLEEHSCPTIRDLHK